MWSCRREARAQWLADTLTAPEKVSVMRLMLHAAKGQLSHARARYARLTAKRAVDQPEQS